MSHPSSRILFAAPDEALIATLHRAFPRGEHNILAVNGLEMDTSSIIEYARASSIEVIISRGGIAEFLQAEQARGADAIPVVRVQVSPFDIIDAIREARETSRRIAFIASAEMLEGIKKITDLFDIDVRLVYRSSPWDCLESIFTALENKAEIIIGDARVVKMCRENAIPAVFLNASEESIRQAYATALGIIEVRDRARAEVRRLTAVLDHLNQGVLALDDKGKVVCANAGAARIMEADKTRLTGRAALLLPFLQPHLPPSLFLEPVGRIAFADKKQRPFTAVWRQTENASCGFAGVLSLEPGRDGPAASPKEKGHEARFGFDDIIGGSEALRKARDRARKYAKADAVVLLQGETGTGKELFAHAIHRASPRRNEPFVAVNLAALPDALIESELFGYVRGAFTDARRSGKQGVFEYAGQGTVFLDEIGEMPLEMQSGLLRVLQDGGFSRLGDDRTLTARCRIIAATNRRLEEAVREGTFRSDLYYRLNILKLDIPSLRDRRGDIPELAFFFLRRECAKHGRASGNITPEALRLLSAHDWPGNVRELRAAIERCVLLCESEPVLIDGRLLCELLDTEGPSPHRTGAPPLPADRAAITEAMRLCGNNRSCAAALLGIHRSTLWRRLKSQ